MTTDARINPDVLEPFLLSQPQVPCPVVHHFGPGVYVREVSMGKGTYAMGNRQKSEHLNIVIKGKVAMIDEKGVNVVSGPSIFTGKPGRKLGYVVEDCVWWNVYPNPDECRDIEELEKRWTERSPIAEEFIGYYDEALAKHYESDRVDYAKVLASLGITDEQVRAETENKSDLVDLPNEYASRVSIRKSPIQGKGLFLSSSAESGELIAPSRIGANRTIAGRYVNHSARPNCEYVVIGENIWLKSIKPVNGCMGGRNGDELTVNYLQALKVAGRLEVTE
jgi:hypothetical protein